MTGIVTAEMVCRLRDLTDQPMMRCKQALEATDGHIGHAQAWLRKPPTSESLEHRVVVLERQVADLLKSRCWPGER